MKIKILHNGVSARFVFWLTFGLLLAFAFTPRGYAQTPEGADADGEPRSFPYKETYIISGYYSPLPDQSFYFRGTYEAEIRLNGRGTNGADGTEVYPGMAAAPRTFPFGTKLGIPGIGVLAVHDRGGAIQGKRLDVWMGRGEDGLRRALAWGMRPVEVTIYGVDPSITESVDLAALPQANLQKILPKVVHFKTDLGIGDSGDAVLELQRFLKLLHYFEGEADGIFDEEVELAVVKFQLEHSIVPSADDTSAGNFGPRSREGLEKLLEVKKDEATVKLPEAPLRPGETGDGVNTLQTVLSEAGYLSICPAEGICAQPGFFDDATEEALFRFQVDRGVVQERSEAGAGFFGPKTEAAVREFVSSLYTPFSGKLISPARLTPLPAQPIALSLKRGDSGEAVVALQEELRRLNFLALQPTGYYGALTEHGVLKFQQAHRILSENDDSGAGAVGPKTLEALHTIVAARKEQSRLIAETTERKKLLAGRLEDEKILVLGAIPPTAFGADFGYGTRGNDVERLQRLLKRLGFFPGRLTTQYFGDITQQSLVAFQKSHGLETSGALDHSTRRILNTLVVPT